MGVGRGERGERKGERGEERGEKEDKAERKRDEVRNERRSLIIIRCHSYCEVVLIQFNDHGYVDFRLQAGS